MPDFPKITFGGKDLFVEMQDFGPPTPLPGPGNHDLGSAIDMIYDPSLPKGTIYLVPTPSALWDSEHPLRFRRDPWGDSPLRPSPLFRNLICPRAEHGHTMADHVEVERRKALDFLSDLLDDWCEEMGEDPEKVWREPRIREQERREMHFHMDARLSMHLVNPGTSAAIKVTGI